MEMISVVMVKVLKSLIASTNMDWTTGSKVRDDPEMEGERAEKK